MYVVLIPRGHSCPQKVKELKLCTKQEQDLLECRGGSWIMDHGRSRDGTISFGFECRKDNPRGCVRPSVIDDSSIEY